MRAVGALCHIGAGQEKKPLNLEGISGLVIFEGAESLLPLFKLQLLSSCIETSGIHHQETS